MDCFSKRSFIFYSVHLCNAAAARSYCFCFSSPSRSLLTRLSSVIQSEHCQPLLYVSSSTVEFDDCAGNDGVTFQVSDPGFEVDGDLKLVPLQNVPYSPPVLFIHGTSPHADDVAQLDVTGLPESQHTLRVSRETPPCGATAV